MSVFSWYEEDGSRAALVHRLGSKDVSTVTVKFRCTGTYEDSAVHGYAAMFFNSNRVYTVLGQSYLVKNYEVSHLGGDAWEVVATYQCDGAAGDAGGAAPLKRARQFDTGGATHHIDTALAESRFPSSSPDLSGAILVDDDSVKGVDVVIPALQWTEQYDVPSLYITGTYIKTVARLTGTTNSGGFRGFAAGEVLFLGCSGQQQWDEEIGEGPWNLSFKFTASENLTNATIGGITGINKKGHEYLWMKYGNDVVGGKLVKKPTACYVNRVYRSEDFSGLGIG
ncbi:MAG: hypothetical protein WCI74_02030 [Actinomycetes bacterium]